MIYAKAAASLIFIISLILIGWKANGWRVEASEAKALRLELRNELQRRVSADADRLALQRKLSESQGRIEYVTKEVIKKVKVNVPVKSECDLNDNVVSVLRDARAGNMSQPPADTPTPSGAARPTP